MNESEGVDRFSIVTAGKALTGKEFDQAIHAYETMHRECKIDLCASMGFISAEQLHRLHEAGVTSYHHNIETSRRNFPNICTTHTFEDKLEVIRRAQRRDFPFVPAVSSAWEKPGKTGSTWQSR